MFCLEPPRVVSISDLSFDWIFTFLGESYGRWRKIKPIDVGMTNHATMICRWVMK